MDQYVTGSIIKQRREQCGLTQAALAEKLCVSDKTISKWETGKGYPDITMLEPLAGALEISLAELFAGNAVINRNRCGNSLRTKFYVCPVCGNILTSMGEAVVSCCGVTLPPLEAEEPDEGHMAEIETVEDEYFIRIQHPMTKEHAITFIAGKGYESVEVVRLYPEGNAETRLRRRGTKEILWYCPRHGLYRMKVPKA